MHLKIKGNSLEHQKLDLRKLYDIRVHYFKKRRVIQKLAKYKPKTFEKLMQKYSKREKRRVNDILHKITTNLVRGLAEDKLIPNFEDLKDLSYNATRKHYMKRKNRKVATLPYRKTQDFRADKHFVACVNILKM